VTGWQRPAVGARRDCVHHPPLLSADNPDPGRLRMRGWRAGGDGQTGAASRPLMEPPTSLPATSTGKAAHSRSHTSPARQPRCRPAPAPCRPPARRRRGPTHPLRYHSITATPPTCRRRSHAHPPSTKRATSTRRKRSPPRPKTVDRRRSTHWASRRQRLADASRAGGPRRKGAADAVRRPPPLLTRASRQAPHQIAAAAHGQGPTRQAAGRHRHIRRGARRPGRPPSCQRAGGVHTGRARPVCRHRCVPAKPKRCTARERTIANVGTAWQAQTEPERGRWWPYRLSLWPPSGSHSMHVSVRGGRWCAQRGWTCVRKHPPS